MKLISTKICKTSDIGVNDILFGGSMLAWLDEAGGIMASSVCCTSNMVTLKIEEVLFKEPVKVKQQIRIYGKVDRLGKTSITLWVEARRADLKAQTEVVVCSTRMVFVRIDKLGNPIPIQAC
ncbi:MAG: hotdog domain-containing protein [Bacteroidales bacterium]|jgi:acyl-CoA thioesterase YciA|nr:hotdog domain-containing protein [Bacteroidales bacterium]